MEERNIKYVDGHLAHESNSRDQSGIRPLKRRCCHLLPVSVHFYRPQTKLREDNVFTGVCDSVHRGMPGPGGVWSRRMPGPGGGVPGPRG